MKPELHSIGLDRAEAEAVAATQTTCNVVDDLDCPKRPVVVFVWSQDDRARVRAGCTEHREKIDRVWSVARLSEAPKVLPVRRPSA